MCFSVVYCNLFVYMALAVVNTELFDSFEQKCSL